MTNNNLILAGVVLCSFGGWYVVLTKYLELKAMMKNNSNKNKSMVDFEPLDPISPDYNKLPENFEFNGKHIPGMGPPPTMDLPFNIPEDLLAKMRNNIITPQKPMANNKPAAPEPSAVSKRIICNWAAIIHLSGLTIVLGIPFLNIIVPALIWLFKKEQHPFLAKQGREVVNFQITFTLIQFLFLGLGTLCIWLMPNAIAGLLAWTKTLRVVFSTGMHLPYNLFTVLPFYWGCLVTIRGAVSVYNGIAYKYPYSQAFIFEEPRQKPVVTKSSAKISQEPVRATSGITNINFS